MAYINKKTGEILTDEEFHSRVMAKQSSVPVSQSVQQPTGKVNFLERLKLGFGGSEAIAKQQQLEREAGLKGKLDLGDIADVAGASLPLIGSIFGGTVGTAASPAGTTVGSAIGAASGQALRRGIGAMIGADNPSIGEVAKDVAFTGAGTYVGGKVLGGLFKAITKAVPKKLISTIFKQSADDIGKEVKSLGKDFTQSEEVLNEGFRGTPEKMMNYAWETMKKLEQQAQGMVKGTAIKIENKNGYVKMIKDYVSNLKKNSFGFENEISKEGQNIISQLSKIKGDTIPGELALATRRFIDGVRRTSSFKANVNLAPKESFYKKAADTLRKKLSDNIPGFREVMNRYSIHINAFDDLAKYAAQTQNRSLFDLIDVFIMYGIDPTAYLARRGVQSAPFITNLAQGLYQGGKVLNKILPKGAVPEITTRGIMGLPHLAEE